MSKATDLGAKKTSGDVVLQEIWRIKDTLSGALRPGPVVAAMELTGRETVVDLGARLALIEFYEGNLREGPPATVKIPRDRLLELGTKAGLTLESEKADLLPYQIFLVLRKPA
jgi:hypothetical protein